MPVSFKGSRARAMGGVLGERWKIAGGLFREATSERWLRHTPVVVWRDASWVDRERAEVESFVA